MQFLGALSKMTTASGRAYLTLLRADRFAVGRIGAAGQISPAQSALELLLRQRATGTLFDLLKRASLPGQLYALLGLAVSDQTRVADVIANYRQRIDEVQTQTACLVSSRPVRDVVARIEDGTYSGLLQSKTHAA